MRKSACAQHAGIMGSVNIVAKLAGGNRVLWHALRNGGILKDYNSELLMVMAACRRTTAARTGCS